MIQPEKEHIEELEKYYEDLVKEHIEWEKILKEKRQKDQEIKNDTH